MSSEEPFLLCYNRGCGQKFKESENTSTSCRFHPGTHYFHDAYKGWTCCRKCIDFTEFLNMKGCATSFHSNVKPQEPEKKKVEISVDEVVEVCQPKYIPLERPSFETPMVKLNTSLSDSLKQQTYQKHCSNGNSNLEQEEEVIKAGVTQCVNRGCKSRYEGPQSNSEICKYHFGEPIFHEGLKYWSCCQKKTTDFDVFMKQEGCQTGDHVWTKPKEKNTNYNEGTKIVKCRQDWHQDGTHVFLVVYGGGKKFDPQLSDVQANPIKLSVKLFFPEENGFYQEDTILAGIISPEASSVLMTPMKVEIKLKKAEPVKWPSLDIPKDRLANIKSDEEKHKNVGVEPVDLSDL